MMTTSKIAAGAKFPELNVKTVDNDMLDISKVQTGADWKIIVVYRGAHCPMCTGYINELEQVREKLTEMGVELALVSADNQQQLQAYMAQLTTTIPMFHGLTLSQMQALGLYISQPRSAQETDHPFAEPGLFVINELGKVQLVDIANNPFLRPNLDKLVSGIGWMKSNGYPIRGTYPAQA